MHAMPHHAMSAAEEIIDLFLHYYIHAVGVQCNNAWDGEGVLCNGADISIPARALL